MPDSSYTAGSPEPLHVKEGEADRSFGDVTIASRSGHGRDNNQDKGPYRCRWDHGVFPDVHTLLEKSGLDFLRETLRAATFGLPWTVRDSTNTRIAPFRNTASSTHPNMAPNTVRRTRKETRNRDVGRTGKGGAWLRARL